MASKQPQHDKKFKLNAVKYLEEHPDLTTYSINCGQLKQRSFPKNALIITGCGITLAVILRIMRCKAISVNIGL